VIHTLEEPAILQALTVTAHLDTTTQAAVAIIIQDTPQTITILAITTAGVAAMATETTTGITETATATGIMETVITTGITGTATGIITSRHEEPTARRNSSPFLLFF